MDKALDVAVLVGSLRKESLNRKVAKTLIERSPESLKMTFVEIGDLPLYNEDLEENPPHTWIAFRERIRKADAILFVTPEYNRSVPAALKNALDVGSRPPKENVWNGKPAAVISATPGALGGFGANNHLRQSLTTLNILAMPTPEAYLSHVHELFDEDGRLINERTQILFEKFIHAFAVWVARFV